MHSENSKVHRADKKSGAATKKGRVIRLSENEPFTAGKTVKSNTAGALPTAKIKAEDIVFALDIGTRTVIGVAGVQEDNCFNVIATEIVEHKNRAMMDGQIHDIEQVAAAAAAVKEKLEARLGLDLKKVAIAAAGRVLKTCQVRVDKNLEQGREIDQEFISSLEIEGIQRAQMILDEETAEEDKTQFYCVGYSVINYYLNGYVISRLTGHKGKNVGADILATFLPLIVVDSLYTVMNKIGLEVSSLTLEPIAAINVTIPPDLRLLNLALVDIGAGTSDIALTKDGSVIAYAMVPFAGDEITEKISQHYLVDFSTGEKIKISLSSSKDKITFTDILKIRRSVNQAEVLKAVEGTMQQLATTISQKILEYNHKAPNAVFLVGGGCRVPGLSEMIARQLELPADRVVVRGRDVIRDIKFSDKKLNGPESITPYGIAVTAQMYSGKDFLSVTVNERKIKLFNSKKLTVADALILYGFDAGHLIGRTGKGITFHIDGEKRVIKGEHGKPAEITVNGRPASIDTPVAYGDNICVVPAEDGKDASLKANELVPGGCSAGTVRLNGNPVDISTIIMINGRQVSFETRVNDGDEVFISQIRTLGDILEAGGMDPEISVITVNKAPQCDLDSILKNGDDIKCSPKTAEAGGSDVRQDGWAALTVQEQAVKDIDSPLLSQAQPQQAQPPQAQPRQAQPPQEQPQQEQPQQEQLRQEQIKHAADTKKSGIQVVVNGKSIMLNDGKQYIFVDIFNHIDFDLTKPKGTIMLRLNGQQAAFTDNIKHGDVIEIFWKT